MKGANMVYLAMFDEVDESTSFFKWKSSRTTLRKAAIPGSFRSMQMVMTSHRTGIWPSADTPKGACGQGSQQPFRPLYPNALSTAAAAPLPVTLVSIAAKPEQNNVQVTWQTSQEFNSSHFEVQRSSDARVFTGIGKVNSHQNAASEHAYVYADNDLPHGRFYYRLENGRS